MTTLFDYLSEFGKSIISLRIGTPSVDLLHKAGQLMQKASEEYHKEESFADALQYGPKSGALVFRKELAKFLSEQYGSPVACEDLLVNAGASQGLHCIGSLLFQSGDLAFVEEPTYFIGLTAIERDFSMNVIGIPTDENGIVVDELEKLFVQHSNQMRSATERKPFSALLYCIPTFNNPTGSVLPAERCRKLIKLVRKYNVLAVCDDVYNLLSYTGDKPPFLSPPRLFTFDYKTEPDYKGNVISNGSFSKLLGPGLRLGWLEVPERVHQILETSGYVRSGGCFNHYTSCIVAKALQLNLVKEHLAFVQQIYSKRLDTLCSSLEKYMPCPFSYRKPSGGFFVWIVLPLEVDCDKLYDVCVEKYNVEFNKGSGFSAKGQLKNCMRLSFSFQDDDAIEDCVKKISLAIKEVLDAK